MTFDLAMVRLTFKFYLDCILETVRCMKLIFSQDIGWGVGVPHLRVTLVLPKWFL